MTTAGVFFKSCSQHSSGDHAEPEIESDPLKGKACAQPIKYLSSFSLITFISKRKFNLTGTKYLSDFYHINLCLSTYGIYSHLNKFNKEWLFLHFCYHRHKDVQRHLFTYITLFSVRANGWNLTRIYLSPPQLLLLKLNLWLRLLRTVIYIADA